MRLQDSTNKQAFKDGFVNLMVYPSAPNVNIIYDDKNYNNREYASYHIPLDKVAQTLDKEEFVEVMNDINADFEIRQLLRAFLLKGEPQFGVRHLDSYHDDEQWRFQILVNFRIYPLFVGLLGHRYNRMQVWLHSSDGVVLTFNMRKKRIVEDL